MSPRGSHGMEPRKRLHGPASRLLELASRVRGLRPRVFAALLLSSAVTLAVAALALLSPLEQRLRNQGAAGVFAAISASRPELAEIGTDSATGRPDRRELALTLALLRRRSGAEITVLDSRLSTVYGPPEQDFDVPVNYYALARRALASGRAQHALVGNELVVAEPMRIGRGGATYAVVLVRRQQYVISTVKVVRNAFLVAAAAGFGTALLLGLALTTTLLRRLERLRDTAARLEERGAEEPIPDAGRGDEIGDLARAFVSLQQRLRRQEQARQAFVATASHELRTPLASLDGTLELLEDDLQLGRLDLDDARERTARAREHSQRLSTLAADLLDLSRLDAELPLRAEPVELGELGRAVAAEFERRAQQRDIELRALPAPGACWAQGDPGAIARIVRILLDNAVGVAPGGTAVTLAACSVDGEARLSVSDAGPGVPAAERARIFERFQRGSASGGRSGFGLGLAIGRELAVRMGGSLSLLDATEQDSGSGERTGACRDGRASAGTAGERAGGACFVVRLPAARPEDTAAG